MSKKLDSILSNVPPATAIPSRSEPQPIINSKVMEPTERIVAVIPKVLKEEMRDYLKNNPKETEKTVILRALKTMGFSIKEEWLVDRRSLR